MKSTNCDIFNYTIFPRSCLLFTSTHKHSPHSYSNFKSGKPFLLESVTRRKCNKTPPTTMVNSTVVLVSALSVYIIALPTGAKIPGDYILYDGA
jgi:hypothetical protein